MRRILLIPILVITLGAFGGCILDPESPPKPPDDGGNTRAYLDRTERWHVLHNLELAYNDRSISRYSELVDATPGLFQFFFSDGDFNDPDDPTPVSWGFDEEISVTRNMFDENFIPDGGDNGAIRDIDLDLKFDPESISWVTVRSDDDTEDWFQSTPVYDYTIEAEPNFTWITFGNSRAEYTIRQQTDGTWKLVRWRDIGGLQ